MLFRQMHYPAATMPPVSCTYAFQGVFCDAWAGTGLGATTCLAVYMVPQLKGTGVHAPSAAVGASARLGMLWFWLDVEGKA